jgi:PAS domain S-box-containing protein
MNDQKSVKPEHDLPAMPIEQAEGNARFAAIIAAISDPLLIIDKTYKVTFQNDVAKELWGENVGAYCYESYQNESASCGECAVTRAWETGRVERIEKSIVSAQGEQFIEIVASPVRDEKGRITGAIEIIHDITKFKKKEQELQNSLAKVKKLSAFLPICSHCKDIRSDEGYWHKIEEYLVDHLDLSFSHGICPDCMKKHYPDLIQE